ncbi:hypothetical protein ACRJ4W_14380 [Streptomyces sp. GLT-R25]
MSEALFRAARVHRLVAGNLLRDTGLYTGQELPDDAAVGAR